ncbi:ACB domain-containing protein [Caenorhabditis elegans]|uniref:ACB domain-containing protein n=1 Tax=Caenorhabditis elegans TaxID=6239 RepID=Q9XTZ5_CAEEL|nr:ACB domain-containing protein [Caenorhabditis elegans]CAB07319.1 ACB domain-containing protein [Caenorhabditis elegans]|eukprot:NP_499531.1 Membrane Associated Acyl-CoA binding protein [Caenorhabditis elegans]
MSVFETAVFIVQNLPKDGPIKTSTDEKLNFYALFKQATHGKCDLPKPSFYDIQGVYKWNAWNKLDNMTMDEAKQAYVDSIVQKIREVQKEYKTEEWMKGDTYELLAPKFEVLGVLEGKDQAVEHPKKTENKETENETDNVETPNSSACILSDNEYADAIDDEIQSRSSSFTEPHNSFNRRISRQSSLKSSCHRLEKELKVITESIDKLGKAVEERHNLLIGLMKKATVYVLVPRVTSWKTIIFFVFWPFVTKFLLRWLRRFLRLLM